MYDIIQLTMKHTIFGLNLRRVKMINVEERYDGSYMCQFRTEDDELITEVYYGYSKEEAMTEFKKLIEER